MDTDFFLKICTKMQLSLINIVKNFFRFYETKLKNKELIYK